VAYEASEKNISEGNRKWRGGEIKRISINDGWRKLKWRHRYENGEEMKSVEENSRNNEIHQHL